MRTSFRFRNFLLLLFLFVTPTASFAQIAIGIGIHIGPPALPVYTQPPCPTDGYIWSPGYWAYGPDGYYWVPGVWIAPPRVGLLWTPGCTGDSRAAYTAGTVVIGDPMLGLYGGINYRIRIWRRGLFRRALGRRPFCVQHGGDECEHDRGAQRLCEPYRDQQYGCESCEF